MVTRRFPVAKTASSSPVWVANFSFYLLDFIFPFSFFFFWVLLLIGCEGSEGGQRSGLGWTSSGVA